MAAGADLSEEELKKEIAKILKNADLNVITMKNVHQELQKVFGTRLNLAEQRPLIRQLVRDCI